MLHFDVKCLIFIAIFVFKIDENCYDLTLVFRRFSAAMAWKNVVSALCSLFFSYDLLTANTSSLVDVEVGRNCELS